MTAWHRAAPRTTRSRRAAPARRRSPRSCASLWPAIPFVAEWTTRSMPWARGCWPIGVANVESTTVSGPLDRGQLIEIDQLEARVRRRLGQHEHRATRLHSRCERARGHTVDERDVDAEPCARTLQERDRARVQLALGDDVVATGADRQHRRRQAPPCRTRTPTHPRHPRARRSPPRTIARSGSSTGCRTRRRASRWPARAHRRGRSTPRRSMPTAREPAPIRWPAGRPGSLCCRGAASRRPIPGTACSHVAR